MMDGADLIKFQSGVNSRIAQREASKSESGDPKRGWGAYGSDHKKYASWFGLPEQYFEEWVAPKKASGGHVCGLDLMSNTAFLASLNIEGVAIGLAQDAKEVQEAALHNRYLVAGDLLSDRKRIWQEVDRVSAQHNFNHGFDIITLRGLAGLVTLTESPVVHFLVLQEMWQRLATGGMLLTEVPYESNQVLENTTILDFWNSIPGIRVQRVKNGVLIEKNENAPMQLPLNFTPLLSTIKSWRRSIYKDG